MTNLAAEILPLATFTRRLPFVLDLRFWNKERTLVLYAGFSSGPKCLWICASTSVATLRILCGDCSDMYTRPLYSKPTQLSRVELPVAFGSMPSVLCVRCDGSTPFGGPAAFPFLS